MSARDIRREKGTDVLSTLMGSRAAGEQFAGFFDSLGALGSVALRNGTGEIWSRPGLSRRDRSLVVISILTALGREAELHYHVQGGLRHGLERDEIDEIVVQLSAYIGVPFALGGAGVVGRAFAELDGTATRTTTPSPMDLKDDATRRADGLDVLGTLLDLPEGADPRATVDATFDELGEAMGKLVIDFAFGEIWARPQLSRRDRSLVVIAALTALNLLHELEIHLGGALNHGVTATEIHEVMLTMILYGGFPRAIDGYRLARTVLAARGGALPPDGTS